MSLGNPTKFILGNNPSSRRIRMATFNNQSAIDNWENITKKYTGRYFVIHFDSRHVNEDLVDGKLRVHYYGFNSLEARDAYLHELPHDIRISAYKHFDRKIPQSGTPYPKPLTLCP